MTNDNELVVDEDGVVLYDASDDKEESVDSHIVGLKENREIFTDEYMEAFAAESDANNARMRRNDRLVSAGVILSILVFTIVLCLIFF